MALFWLIIIIVILWMIVKVVTSDTAPEQQAESEKSDEEVLANAQRLLALTEAATQAKECGRDDVYQAIMANTYDGPLPERRADGGWTSIFDDLRILSIAGINHRQAISHYKGRNTVALVPEPKNEFDPNAIKVIAEDGHHLGYIHRDQTDMVRSWAHDKFPHYCICMIQEHDDEDDGHRFYTGYLYFVQT
jgi:Na+-transporting methylmalonyl-CoA/oxaloacetate decarboxylase gamma subunit